MPKVTIDGKEIEVAPGTSVIQAAEQAGVRVPRFCYHDDLPVDGNCRMCMVEIEKFPKLQIACGTPVTDGMVVKTQVTSEKAKEAQKNTLEFLLVNHPIDCPVCDQAGECYLQDQYMDNGLHDSRTVLEEKIHKRKVVDIGPILLDAERCVVCSRCIRYEREVTKTNLLEFVNRGGSTQISTYNGGPITHEYAGNLVDVCPVGALLSKDFRFKMRVWFLKETDSICPGCSTGCNITIDHRDGEAYRASLMSMTRHLGLEGHVDFDSRYLSGPDLRRAVSEADIVVLPYDSAEQVTSGVLTEAVRRKPYSVVLLDEVEKAHPDVMELFFQVFDKGVLEDGEGREIDFKNCIILLTSNVGTDTIMTLCADPDTRPGPDGLVDAVKPELNKAFKPALLGRMVTVPYYPISDDILRLIIKLQLGKIAQRIKDNHNAAFSYDDAVIDTIAKRCTDVDSGARNVYNILTGTLLPEMSGEVLSRMAEGDALASIRVSVGEGENFAYSFA